MSASRNTSRSPVALLAAALRARPAPNARVRSSRTTETGNGYRPSRGDRRVGAVVGDDDLDQVGWVGLERQRVEHTSEVRRVARGDADGDAPGRRPGASAGGTNADQSLPCTASRGDPGELQVQARPLLNGLGEEIVVLRQPGVVAVRGSPAEADIRSRACGRSTRRPPRPPR